MCWQQADWICNGIDIILNRQSPSDSEVRKEIWKKIGYDINGAKLKVLVYDPESLDRRLILRTRNIGGWLYMVLR